jgi:RNA polymerase sigma-70 factor, ECF subfamily
MRMDLPIPDDDRCPMPHPCYDASRPAEADLIGRALQNDEAAVRSIIRQHNRRLFRIARSMVRDDGDAEDILQEAYLHAFSSLAAFRGDSSLATWLTRIVVNEALQRLRRRIEMPVAETALERETLPSNIVPFPLAPTQTNDPERTMAQREMTRLVEREIDKLPDEFRTVLVARVLEDMSIEETAEALGLRPETVKTRLHRARRLLRTALMEQFEPTFADVFPFDGQRCSRLADAVVERLKKTL